jgi:hypothetical protein
MSVTCKDHQQVRTGAVEQWKQRMIFGAGIKQCVVKT